MGCLLFVILTDYTAGRGLFQRQFHKTVVEAEVVADGVLPAPLVRSVAVVRVEEADDLEDWE